MVQRFSQLHRVHQRAAGSIISVKLFDILARDQECGDTFAVSPDTDVRKITAFAQEKCASKYVCGLKTGGFQE